MKFTPILVILLTSILYSQPKMFEEPLSPRIANYTMEVNFDPEAKMLMGSEKLTWKNTSSDYLASMYFHLYLNGLKHAKTTFLANSPDAAKELEGGWGACDIKKITLKDGTDITDYIRFIHPDDSNLADSTVIALDLPNPIKPHGEIALNIEFEVTIPKLAERCGYYGDFFHLSQWFPKVGVYENGEWVCHQYHSMGEFYADYGVYDVTITSPSNYILGSTGILIEKKEIDGKTTYKFYCEDVHDFAWSADTDLVEILDEFEGTRIRLLHQSGHEGISARLIKAIKVTLDYYGDNYGKYPWPQVTCIDSPIYPAVMEYPTLFVTGNYQTTGGNADPGLVSEKDKFMEMLTIHEFGHNWWQGLVGNNETKEMWLDESLNSYATLKAFEYAYGDVMLERDSLKDITLRGFERNSYVSFPKGMVTKKAWEFDNGTEFFVMCYPKGMFLFVTLENYYGKELSGKFIKTFYERWRFKHPTTEDLLDVIYEIFGNELEPFITEYLYTSHTLDYAIDKVEDKRAVIKRNGYLTFPVNMSFKLSDGTVENRTWNGGGGTFNIEFNKDIVEVEIDPEYIIEFDLKKENNFWKKK